MTERIKRTWRRLTPLGRLLALVALAGLAGGLSILIARGVGEDADGDGMSDLYENFFGLDPNSAVDAQRQDDADALDNLAESGIWTDPFAGDTDADGWLDSQDDDPLSRAVLLLGSNRFVHGDAYLYTGPVWWLGAGKEGGDWTSNAWHVAQESEGTAQLLIAVDRGIVTNDLRLDVELTDHAGSTLHLDLLDTNAAVVAEDLFGNLTAGSGQERLLNLDIPFAAQPEAAAVALRREAGEVTVRSAVLYEDADGDGLDIGQERQLGTSDTDADSDHDGLSDRDEVFTYDTQPLLADTDGDGAFDGFEVLLGLDPLTPGDAPSRGRRLAAGKSHTLLVPQDGALLAWGNNGEGQLGTGTAGGVASTPAAVHGPDNQGTLTGVVAVAAGELHSLALLADGTVWTFGANGTGQLGDGGSQSRSHPGPVAGPGGIGLLSNVVAIAAGEAHSLALLADGTVVAWGDNGSGRLGDGTTVTRKTPVAVSGPGGAGRLTGIVAISAGGSHSVALRADGTVWAWGFNAYGRLGDGTTQTRFTPVQVAGLGGVKAVAAGSRHTLALLTDGTVRAWGFNAYGRLGDGTTTSRLAPVAVLGAGGTGVLTNIVAICAGSPFSAAVAADGSVWTWGGNESGVLGIGTGGGSVSPVQVKGENGQGFLADIAAIAAGWLHGAALRSDGTVWCWGNGGQGRLGDGTTQDRSTPVIVDSDADGLRDDWEIAHFENLSQGATGDPDGDALANSEESLQGTDPQNADTDSDSMPDGWESSHALDPLSAADAAADPDGDGESNLEEFLAGTDPQEANGAFTAAPVIAAGLQHSLAVLHSGQVVAWGGNGNGRLGFGTSGGSTGIMTRVVGTSGTGTLSNVAGIAAADEHSLALLQGNTVLAWGNGYAGRLGDNQTSDRTHPGSVLGSGGTGLLGNVVDLAVGEAHSLALRRDGSVWAWGDGDYGKLGDSNNVQRTTPVQVHGANGVGYLRRIHAVAAGKSHSLAVRTDGTVFAWGNGADGRLGENATTTRKTPIQVHGVGDSGFLTGIVAVVAGDLHSLALRGDGTVFAWGSNADGRLGDNTSTERKTPVQVHGPGDAGYLTNVTAIASGQRHNLALKGDGTVWAWGKNDTGQLGDNTTTLRKTPVQVLGPGGTGHLTNVVAIAARGEHNLALTADGSLYAWGANAQKQLGDNTTTMRKVPVLVDGDADGLCDLWEMNRLGGLSYNAGADPDSDGLTNAQEFSHGADPLVADSDGDGFSDGAEVTAGTNPLDPYSRPIVPVTLSGETSYGGPQHGTLTVLAATSNGWEGAFSVTLSAAGAYAMTNVLAPGTYWVRAWIDANSNGTRQAWEPMGDWTNNPIALWSATGGVAVALADPDADADGLPDWWEAARLGGLSYSGSDDPDADGLGNAQEFSRGTDPLDADSDGDGFSDGAEAAAGTDPLDPQSYPIVPVTVSGEVVYAGPQQGPLTVLAALTNGWEGACSVVLSEPGAYALTNVLAPGTYWVRAWIDANSNGTREAWEPMGEHTNSPLSVAGALAGIDVRLRDPDSDDDGLPDWWELKHFGDLSRDGDTDTDGDWMINVIEYLLGTDPNAADSDGDGLDDFEESVLWNTDPTAADSDGDGMNDGWETLYGFDPLTLQGADVGGRWPLDETAGAVAADLSGNGNDGAIEGALHVPAQVAYGLSFTGLADTVVMANDAAYKPQRLTVGARARFATRYGNEVGQAVPAGAMTILGQGDGAGGYAYAFAKSERNSLLFLLGGVAIETEEDFVVTAADSPDGGFYHLVGAYDGTNVCFYVNGSLVGQAQRAGALPYDAASGLVLGGGEAAFAGVLDDVLVLAEALSASAVEGLDDGIGDSDADGFSNAEEEAQDTDPRNADMDGDGLGDYAEVRLYGTNPRAADSDGDGLSDYEELMARHTDPLSADSDADGLSDPRELDYGLDPAAYFRGDIGAWWPLDETNGTVAADASGHGNDAAIFGAASVTGRIAMARSFDGVDDAVVAGADTNAKPAKLTVSFHVRLDARYGNAVTNGAEAGRMTLLSQANSAGGYAWALYKTGRNSLVFALDDPHSGESARVESADDCLVADRWCLLTATFDGTTAALYLDGEPVTAVAHDSALDYAPGSGPAMGRAGLGLPDGALKGALDDARILRVALDAAKVRALTEPFRDDDADGLENREEVALGTRIDNADTDGDGLSDYEEARIYGTNPLSADTDGDGMPDEWETAHGLNPSNPADAALDPDGDGLTNLEEYRHGTDPHNADSDGDGLSDGAEVNTYGTDPLKADTDGDGINDGVEVAHGLNPKVADGLLDPDGDGLDNAAELAAGTNPNNADSDGDGVCDGVEVLETLTDPLHADFDGTVTDVDMRHGAQTNAALGAWEPVGQQIMAKARRGFVEYQLTAPAADMYRIAVRATHLWHYSDCDPAQPVDTSALLVYVDGRYLGRRELVAPDGIYGTLEIFTPWTGAGAHRVRLVWENVNSRVSLLVRDIRLQALGGPDADHDGVKDWVESSVANMTSLDAVPATSVVSPVCIEGRDRYVDMMGCSAAAVRPGIAGRWYADVPLAPSGPTSFTVSYQSNAYSRAASVTWTALNVAGTKALRIRKGDSVKFTAQPDGAVSGQVQVVVGQEASYDTGVGAPVAHTFNHAGQFLVLGYFNGAELGQATVDVIGAEFPAESPACMLGKWRTWNCPGLPAELLLESDPTVSVVRNGNALSLLMNKVNQDHYLVARLPAGPVLATRRLDGFWIQAAIDSILTVVERHSDAALWQSVMVTKALPATVDVQLRVIASGVTFDDHTLERWAHASDLDALGEYPFRLLMPDSVRTTACHYIKAYQGGVYLGEAYYAGVLLPDDE